LKKTLLLSFLFVIRLIAFGQTLKEYNHSRDYPIQKMPRILKCDPLAILSGPVPFFTSEYALLFESPTARKQSMEVGISQIAKGPGLYLFEQIKSQPYNPLSFLVKGVKFQFTYKFFLRKKKKLAPRGWYIGPKFDFSSVGIGQTYDYSRKNNYLRFTSYSAGVVIGNQVIRRSARGLVFDWFVGMGYKKNVCQHYYNTTYWTPYNLDGYGFYASPFHFILGFHLGWSFCPKEKK
jgi:hypothetical protein